MVADVVRDVFTNILHVGNVFGEESQAAGCLRDFLQCPFRALGVFLALFAEQADGVDHRVGLLNFTDGLFQRIMARVVFAVGDHEQNLFIFLALFHVVERADNRVVKRGAASRVDALQRFLKLRNAAAEVLIEVEVEIVVKIDDESLVLRIAGFHERQGRGVYPWPLVAHASAVVDHQAHADRDVFALE